MGASITNRKNDNGIFLNEQGIYTIPKAYYLEENIKVNIFDDLYISLKEFIEENKELIEQEQEEDV